MSDGRLHEDFPYAGKDALLDLADSDDGRGRLDNPDATVQMDNPYCGDRITLDVTLAGDAIDCIGHEVRGCILCEAAATAVARHAPGKTADDIASAAKHVRSVLESGKVPPEAWAEIAHANTTCSVARASA